MEAAEPYFRVFLKEELHRRVEKNPLYSLRAFAHALEMDPGALSRVLSGKQPLAPKRAKSVLAHLDLSPPEQDRFLKSAIQDRARVGLRKYGEEMVKSDHVVPDLMSLETFRVISQLHHYALLELTETDNFQPNINSIAKRLGITPTEAKLSLDRLVGLDLLKVTPDGFKKTHKLLEVENKKSTNPSLRRQQKDILSRALNSIENTPIEKRVANSMTMAIDPSRIEIAREIIAEFCRELCQVLETGNRTKVYQAHINLFPLEKEESQ